MRDTTKQMRCASSGPWHFRTRFGLIACVFLPLLLHTALFERGPSPAHPVCFASLAYTLTLMASRASQTRKGFLHELVALLKYGLPVSLATLCRLLTFVTDASFVGSLGPTFFAAMALAQVPPELPNQHLLSRIAALSTKTPCTSLRIAHHIPLPLSLILPLPLLPLPLPLSCSGASTRHQLYHCAAL